MFLQPIKYRNEWRLKNIKKSAPEKKISTSHSVQIEVEVKKKLIKTKNLDHNNSFGITLCGDIYCQMVIKSGRNFNDVIINAFNFDFPMLKFVCISNGIFTLFI